MERISVGSEGLDAMLGGGLLKGRPYLILGGPGAGKTILSMQFLLCGAKLNEKGMYVSLDEPISEIKQNMKILGWDVSKIHFFEAVPRPDTDTWHIGDFEIRNFIGTVRDEIEEKKLHRLVIDSLTTIALISGEKIIARKNVLTLLNFLAESGCTSLLLSESGSEEHIMDEYLARGVINLMTLRERKIRRVIQVEKMRGTSFDEQLRPYTITKEGIVVYPKEEVF